MPARVICLLALCVACVASGCGGNAALKSARRSLIVGDARTAFARLEAEARETNDRDVLLALAEAAALVERDSIAHASLARVESRGKDDKKRAAVTRERIWRELFVSAQAVIDTLELAGQGDRARARATLERADAYDAGHAATAASLGTLYLEAGDLSRSDSLFAEAVARGSADRGAIRPVVTALVRAATVHRDAGRIRRAVEIGRETVEIAPGDARARFDHGVNLHALAEETGDPALFAEAVEQFEAVLAHVPDDVDAAYNLALSQLNLGDADAARETLGALMPRAVYDPRVHRLAARLALDAGDRDGARPHVVAMRALEGEARPVPSSALLVSPAAGRAGAKRFALDGKPARVYAYTERQGSVVEAWFYPALRRVYGYSGGVSVAALDY